jgi:hypothetical protein
VGEIGSPVSPASHQARDWSAGPVIAGAMAEWLCSGLQSRVRRFNSGSRLHPSMKKAELEKLKGKKVQGTGSTSARGDQGTALGRREQALARKRALLEKLLKSK